MLHWGLIDDADSSCENTGRAERPKVEPLSQPPALVFTEAGEVLIRRISTGSSCLVAMVIGPAAALSRPQVERMQRAWDVAIAVADGNSEAIHLQPMPQHWRFSRADYLTWDEWLETRSPDEARRHAIGVVSSLGGRGVRH